MVWVGDALGHEIQEVDGGTEGDSSVAHSRWESPVCMYWRGNDGALRLPSGASAGDKTVTDFERRPSTSPTFASTGSINDTITQACCIRRTLSEHAARLTGAGIDRVRMFRVPRGTASLADWMLAVDTASGATVTGLVAAGWYSLLQMIFDGLDLALRLDVSPSSWLRGADAVALEGDGVVVFAAEYGRRPDLDDVEAAVIRAVLACTRMSVLQALRWYDQQPIPGHGKTPAQLVAEGRVDAVMNHLSRLRSEGGGDA